MEYSSRAQETAVDEPVALNENDLGWLLAFELPPESADQADFLNTLNELSRQGSVDLRLEGNIGDKAAIMKARRDFFNLLGLGGKMAQIARFERKTNPPYPESFIITQRELYPLGLDGLTIARHLPYCALQGNGAATLGRKFELLQELGLDPVATINRFPTILGFSEETLRAKIQHLEELGLKPIHVVSRFPTLLGFSEETLRSKVRCLIELGLEPAGLVKRSPVILSFSEETLRSKVRCLEDLGLEPLQVVGRNPPVLGFAEATIRSKVRCLEDLGLEPLQVVGRNPPVLGLAEATIRSKVAFFKRTTSLLQWEYTAEELLNSRPILLNFNFKKLQILRRVLALNIASAASEGYSVGQIRKASSVSVEAYLIVLADLDAGTRLGLNELRRRAEGVHKSLTRTSRREAAKKIAESANKTLGGRICRMYLEYAKT